ncbi:MAG: ABC transporter ATP-binding protein [Polyangiaceae bacterium]
MQAQMAGDVGGLLRGELLDAWLAVHRIRRSRQTDHAGAMGSMGASVGEQARGVAALTTRVRDVEAGLEAGVLGAVRAVGQLVPLAILLIVISPKLAAAALAVFVPFSVALGAMRKRWKRVNAEATAHGDALLDAADDAIRNAELWTTYGAESKVRIHVADLGKSITRQSARVQASAAALTGANEILGAVALVFAIAAARAGWLGEGGESGALLAFAVAFFLAYKPIRELTDARLAWIRASVAYEGISEILATRPDAVEAPSASKEWPLAALEIEGLSLVRGGLTPLTLSVKAGEIVALSGPTGVGKTTLIRTLLGLEAPTAGLVRYDGAVLGSAPPGPTGRPFAWVPQDAPLLGDTLEANVLLGSTTASVDDVLGSLGASHLARDLGLSRLGAGARAVSGGERQWIVLARAIATHLPVLLLDEPTSGLDAASQKRVLDAIAGLRGKRTVLLVTHRPEPLAIADSVVTFTSRPSSS